MLRAKKSLGQTFLVDERIAERIVGAVDPRAGETLIEIGPGHGALTSRLLATAGRLVAVEFDRDLIPLLEREFSGYANFALIEGDALHVDLCSAIAPATTARVVANLPYYISTAILQRLIEQRRCLSELILMLQREVVDRITARPSTRERGFFSVLVEAYFEVERVFDVAPAAFRPVPRVWSSVVRLYVRPEMAADVKDEELLWHLVSAGFAHKRKTIFNNLRSVQSGYLDDRIEKVGGAERLLELSGLEPQRRAETLTLQEWARLSRTIDRSL